MDDVLLCVKGGGWNNDPLFQKIIFANFQAVDNFFEFSTRRIWAVDNFLMF